MQSRSEIADRPDRVAVCELPGRELACRAGRYRRCWSAVIARGMTYYLRPAKMLRVYCPVDAQTLQRLLHGDSGAIEFDATLARLLAIVRGDNPLGDFGIYKAVAEIGPGWELFTPTASASPALGSAGEAAASPTAVLTVYFPADTAEEAVRRCLEAIMDAHPWEVPVIELRETSLLQRA